MAARAPASIPREAPAVRAALAEHSPDECASFDAEFREALQATEADFDLTRVEAVLDRWWGIAHLRTHPPTEREQNAVERAAAGDFSGLYSRDGAGWSRL